MAREWDVPGYTEVKVLGSGGFGEVVLARHGASGTAVAIKYLRRQLLADPEFAELFRAEAAVLASLDDPADGAALVAELRAVAGGAYGPGWEDRGRSGLAAAALLLAALWPTGGPAAVQGSTVYRVRLRRRLPHGQVSVAKAAITAGVVAAGVAVAAGVILARPTGHPTPAPTPTPARATAPAPAPARATAPAQWTGTQLAAALLPLSDFPAGYREQLSLNTGALFPQPDAVPTANCRLGDAVIIVDQGGSFATHFGTADATESLAPSSQPVGVQTIFLSQAVFQFASPANAETFFSSVRTCLIDNKAWSHGVDTAPVNGDQAVTADLLYNNPAASIDSSTEPLFVLHGTDVFALSAAAFPVTLGPVTIPGAAELIAKLIARVDALGPAPSAVSSPASAAVSSPGLPPRRQAAQALAALLAQSGTDRTAVTQAVSAVADCSPGLSQDETIFSNAASSHQALLGKLAALPDRSALPASMLQDLTTAWQTSGEADQDFAKWAQDEISQGCSTNYQSDASYQAATVPDDQATKDKKAFAALWTAIANEYGLPLYQYNQI